MAAPSQTNSTTTGTTPKTVLAADPTRRTVCIQNESDEDMRFNFLAAAGASAGWVLAAGQSRVMRFADWPMIIGALSVYGATSGKAYNVHDDVN
jgi:hypothetical protein